MYLPPGAHSIALLVMALLPTVLTRSCTTRDNVVAFAVGAVYDSATFESEWAKCAVMDRAYSWFHSVL